MINVNWEKEAEHINTYADWKVEPTKESVLDYIGEIISINGGVIWLFDNEYNILERIKHIWLEEN